MFFSICLKSTKIEYQVTFSEFSDYEFPEKMKSPPKKIPPKKNPCFEILVPTLVTRPNIPGLIYEYCFIVTINCREGRDQSHFNLWPRLGNQSSRWWERMFLRQVLETTTLDRDSKSQCHRSIKSSVHPGHKEQALGMRDRVIWVWVETETSTSESKSEYSQNIKGIFTQCYSCRQH